MSYCRWSECDVYAYDSCEGGVRFWVAGNDSLNRLCGTYNEAYQYAKELRDKHGLDVPLHAIDELREDAINEAKGYLGPDSAVADILDENVKLRELCADMYGFIKRMDEDCGDVTFSDCFDYCKHDTADDGCCKTGECWYEQRLRELGIEVGG